MKKNTTVPFFVICCLFFCAFSAAAGLLNGSGEHSSPGMDQIPDRSVARMLSDDFSNQRPLKDGSNPWLPFVIPQENHFCSPFEGDGSGGNSFNNSGSGDFGQSFSRHSSTRETDPDSWGNSGGAPNSSDPSGSSGLPDPKDLLPGDLPIFYPTISPSIFDDSPSVVPEPSTILLLSMGIMGMLPLTRRRIL
ncbi:MAG: PEP-CTERM sorting domain-containing protein [Candidatus Omnitrophica bacterium]|nr:PEP-CTERM sorting domain-containing protein [Candidatus Omnitrophota bacterium]